VKAWFVTRHENNDLRTPQTNATMIPPRRDGARLANEIAQMEAPAHVRRLTTYCCGRGQVWERGYDCLVGGYSQPTVRIMTGCSDRRFLWDCYGILSTMGR
jgi:hypothetical protein